MMIVKHKEEFAVAGKNDLAVVRQHLQSMADEIGMSQMKEMQMRTAATELLTNMMRYAGGGNVIIEQVERSGSRGLRAQFRDEGPGIPDIEAALAAGFTTGKGLGHGLSGCKNLVDVFDLQSEPGKGTTVVITKWC